MTDDDLHHIGRLILQYLSRHPNRSHSSLKSLFTQTFEHHAGRSVKVVRLLCGDRMIAADLVIGDGNARMMIPNPPGPQPIRNRPALDLKSK